VAKGTMSEHSYMTRYAARDDDDDDANAPQSLQGADDHEGADFAGASEDINVEFELYGAASVSEVQKN